MKENIPANECGILSNNYSPEVNYDVSNNTDLGLINFTNILYNLGLFYLPHNQEKIFSKCLLPLFMDLDIFITQKKEIDLKPQIWNKVPLNKQDSLLTINCKESDMVSQYLVNNDSDSDAPKATNIKFIDQYQSADLDGFYKVCQKHRDQYRDPQNKLHGLDFFAQDKVAYQCPPEITSTYLKYPTYYTTYRHPIVLPRTLERTSGFIPLPERVLRGRYQKYSDFTYKR